ncbi:MAG TPA: carboxypeptidase-like regulatory domain-containing protein [Terriglobales bacterium]|nr:carboxypeptidase-like regulatory domain-containing protein [Terriglobales bacterium]
MTLSAPRLVLTLLAAAALAAAQAASAGQNVTGSVLNLTTGQPLAHVPVTLVQLQGSMNTLATAATDSSGHYRFSENSPGPFMVQTQYEGVSYFAKVADGQNETNLQVYNVSHDASLLRVDAEIMVLQPDQGQLAIVNEYRIENGLQPLRTLAAQGGMFRFRVPPGAHVDMVRVVGPGEMPLAHAPTPTADHDVYSVDAALRPGETRVQISYRVPYAGLKAALTETPVTLPAHFEVYVPDAMTFAGDGFTQVGTQQGYKVYGVAAGPVAATLHFNVSGDAPMPSDATADGSAPVSSGAAPQGDASTSTVAAAPAAAVPAPTLLERNRWTIAILLLLAAAAGFGMLFAKPEPEVIPVAAIPVPSVEPVQKAPGLAYHAAAALSAPPPTQLPGAPNRAALPAADDLNRLKDDLFLLEVRRHTGRIAEAEYQALRAEINSRMDHIAGRNQTSRGNSETP